ncbi:MAG: hypothetical protein K0R14_1957 [Burkholderiales bacterium]|jgi:hypothetical protein|nr:hypothetical protein [Burkholderiales bacterium]
MNKNKLDNKDEIDNARDQLENSANNLGTCLNETYDLINDIIFKFNVIPNALITGFLLSSDVRSILQDNLILRWIYIVCIASFFSCLLIISIYLFIHEYVYGKRHTQSVELLEASKPAEYNDNITTSNQFIKKVAETIQRNNEYLPIFKKLSLAKIIVLAINLLTFLIFIIGLAYIMTNKPTNNTKYTQASTNFATDHRPKVTKPPVQHQLPGKPNPANKPSK